MNDSLYLEDLQKLHCHCKQCKSGSYRPLYLSPNCHPTAPVYCVFDPMTERLLFTCAVCERPIVEINVARKA